MCLSIFPYIVFTISGILLCFFLSSALRQSYINLKIKINVSYWSSLGSPSLFQSPFFHFLPNEYDPGSWWVKPGNCYSLHWAWYRLCIIGHDTNTYWSLMWMGFTIGSQFTTSSYDPFLCKKLRKENLHTLLFCYVIKYG